MVIVRDYYDIEDRWITWQSTSLQSAYVDYPYNGVEGYPTVDLLAGRIFVVRTVATSSTSTTGVSPSTVWVLDGSDIYPEFNLSGHTGEWGILIHEPAATEEQVYGLSSDNEDLVISDDMSASLLTVDSLDVYPSESGLPDIHWLKVGTDLILNITA